MPKRSKISWLLMLQVWPSVVDSWIVVTLMVLVDAAQAAVAEAEAYLAEQKAKPGSAQGILFVLI